MIVLIVMGRYDQYHLFDIAFNLLFDNIPDNG